ncbi:nucleotidyltransferase family protein [Sphingobium yanoikuyae]|uniref:nucleotidyltransferase family protein n=1 Tax=Sphingobium yanoikuyae TaxID=13690 RepID=UPI0028A6F54D|nr:nucleotidyltransferase family protein [Sphingobium yanoikuyae]
MTDVLLDTSRKARKIVDIVRCHVALSVPQMIVSAPSPAIDADDWAGIITVGKSCKLLLHLGAGLRAAGHDIPDAFSREEDRFRKLTLAMNGVNIATITNISKNLIHDDLRFIVFKGPLAQRRIYGGYFHRPSSDVDILIDRGDLRRCTALLQGAGYFLPAECDRIWWRAFLGEQHFFSRSPNQATVDVHHRLQQPGCPHPMDVGAFLREPADQELGQVKVPCISPIHEILLASLSFVKSLTQHCHAAAYLLDFCAVASRLDSVGLADLHQRAMEQNIEHSLRITIACADSIYGLKLSGFAAPLPIADLFGDDLSLAIFTPDDPSIAWPRLRQLLWRLCDDRRTGQKLGTYIWVGGSFLASKAARKMPSWPREEQSGMDTTSVALSG